MRKKNEAGRTPPRIGRARPAPAPKQTSCAPCGRLFQREKYRQAQKEFGKAFESVGDPAVYAALCSCYAQALKGEPASPAQSNVLSPYLRAILHLSMNRREQALDSLEQAYEERSSWLVNLNVEPTLDGLRSDPRLENLLRRIGLTPAASRQ